ncbi:NADH-quinone oxidoreductase subunit M [Bacteroidetes/Chlorobi group bacterium ChocPot_Mid]|jgi:NADH-quinone oxidoreductase subunit M|nr:MAG: NADH-quinone oxidoreductase subunit M [Bacteroidetes/Chlorobi group bacterium ChocPot_Mid]
MTALLLTLFLPLAGSILLLFVKREQTQLIKTGALVISLLSFIASVFLLFSFDQSNPGFQFVINQIWVESFDAGFRIGVDGMSMLLLMLTTFISPITILSSFYSIHKRDKEYYVMMLLLQFGMTGVFISLDLFLFYIFWEIILIPMYFIIGVWGGKNRIYAAVKFFIFTVVGSLFMLVAIVWLGHYVGTEIIKNAQGFTTNFMVIRDVSFNIPFDIQKWMFLAFALSFCIKVPLFPLHTWLPDAHTEAPTPGSVILAGVLLKMGTYGLIRFNLELFPQSAFAYASPIAWLAVIGIIYGALVSLVQTDIKKLVAYSSVSHLGFVVLGIFSMTATGIQGAIIQMVNHGLTTGMLFLIVGMIYERRHTREISEFGGIARVMPVFTVFFGIALLGSVGLPGLNGFVGEYLTLIGAFTSPFLDSWAYSIIAASGVIFAACYLLWMFQRVMFGTNDNPQNHNLKDLGKQEWATLVPIVIFIVWIGIYPSTFLNISENSTKALVNKLELIKFGKAKYELPTEMDKIKLEKEQNILNTK